MTCCTLQPQSRAHKRVQKPPARSQQGHGQPQVLHGLLAWAEQGCVHKHSQKTGAATGSLLEERDLRWGWWESRALPLLQVLFPELASSAGISTCTDKCQEQNPALHRSFPHVCLLTPEQPPAQAPAPAPAPVLWWGVSCYSHSRLRILHLMGAKRKRHLTGKMPAESISWCVLPRSQQQPQGLLWAWGRKARLGLHTRRPLWGPNNPRTKLPS